MPGAEGTPLTVLQPCQADSHMVTLMLLRHVAIEPSHMREICCDTCSLCGRPVQMSVLRHVMKFRSLPMLGETLAFTVARMGCQDGVTHFKGQVMEAASAREVMLLELHAAAER